MRILTVILIPFALVLIGCPPTMPPDFIGGVIDLHHTRLSFTDTNEILISIPEEMGIPEDLNDIQIIYTMRNFDGENIIDTCYTTTVHCLKHWGNLSCETAMKLFPDRNDGFYYAIIRYSHNFSCMEEGYATLHLKYQDSESIFGITFKK